MKSLSKWFMAAVVIVSLGLTGCSRESTLEESAVPLVSTIIADNGGSAKCINVEITEKIGEKHYKATATLDNGNTIKIMIEDRGDQLYVSIPLDQR